MPVLKKEPSVYPPGLLESGEPAAARTDWWAVYTKPRQEKALARDLLGRSQPFYLPLVPHPILAGGKRRLAHLPLFPGYLFIAGGRDSRLLALKTNRAVAVVPAPDGQQLARQLCHIYRLIESGQPVRREPRLVPGRRVRIRTGPMSGLEGTIVRRQGAVRFIVAVDFLQQGASVAVDDVWLEALD